MKLHIAAAVAALLTLAVVLGASSEKPGPVELARLNEENWERFAPGGKEVDAIYGDFVLRNEHLTAVIAQPVEGRNANMTVRDVGGALLDLTVREDESDQLSAFYPGRRQYPYRAATAHDAEGRRVDLEATPVYSGAGGELHVIAEASAVKPKVETTYRLEAGDRFLTVTSRYTNAGNQPIPVPLEDDLRADGQLEDMVKSPNGRTKLFWVHDRFWGQAYGFDADGLDITANSNPRESVLRYGRGDAETKTLAPGDSFELVRHIYPADNLLNVRASAAERTGGTPRPVKLVLRDGGGRSIRRAMVDVLSGAGEELGGGRTGDEGELSVRLAPGKYRARVTVDAIPLGETSGYAFTVNDVAGDAPQTAEFRIDSFRPGFVRAQITDEAGDPIPCKVEFQAKDGTPQPNFGPQSAEFSTGNLCYAPHGKFRKLLPPGRYDVIISHGPEYDAVFTEIAVPPDKTVDLTATLKRSVHTPGWISTDFHSHSSPSGDNTGSQLGRVLNLVCEHIEFAPCTEHNRISTYEPHIEQLKIGKHIATVSGIELTGSPLPLNHQNAFPLIRRPHTQDGGAPQTDTDPEVQFERLALWDDRSRKLIQQNHPDIGWLFYDKNGDGEHDEGYSRSFPHMDVVEIHPIQHALDYQPVVTYSNRRQHNRVFNWLQLLNQGFRIYGVTNTDAHYNFHGSGWLRNWIQSSTDDPANIDSDEMVVAAEEGRLIMSNGPYLEVSLNDAGGGMRVTAGQDLAAMSGKCELRVRVQCANWLDIDQVTVFVNGRPHQEHDYRRDKQADRFKSGVIKFEEMLPLELESDAHVVVVTGSAKYDLGPVMGPQWGETPPAAISNPIFVDVDGGGFKPNGDTLDAPLPVKFRE
ncbi:MAG: CehA/McbA family metallohydrolase [Planctomycetes bacterium]|nr:CehA/McbA family metallohydrolase [Planctomycetota bacterium]